MARFLNSMIVPASQHTLFMRGFSGTMDKEDIRDFFTKEGGKCSFDFIKLSDDRRFLFVALRFESKDVAKEMLARYNETEILGCHVSITWYKDLRKARQKAFDAMKDKRESRYDKRQSPSRKRSTSSNDDKQRSPSSFDERNNDDSQDNDEGLDKKRADEPEEEEEGSEEGEIRNKEDDEPRSAVDGRHGNNTDDDGRFGNNADDKKRHRKAPSRRFYNTRSSAAKRAAARKSSSRSASPPTSPAPRSKKDTTATVNGYTSDHNKDETGSYASSHGPTSPERKRSMSPNYSSTRRRNVYNYRGRGRRGTNRGFRGGYNYSQYSRHGRRGAPKTPSLSPPPLDDEAENTTSAQNKGVETNDMSARTESKSKSNSFNTSHNANISNSNTNTNNNRDIESPLDEYEEDEEDLQKLGLLKNINAANYKANAKESANQASLHHHDEPPPPPPHKEDINGPMEKSTTSGIRYHIKGLTTNNKSSSTTINQNHKYRAEGEGWNISISPSNRRSASPGSHHPAHNEAGGAENDGASDAEYRDESRYKHGGSGSHKQRNHSPSRGSYPHYKGNRDRYASMNGAAGHHNKYRSYNQRKSGEYRSNNTSSNKYGVEDEGGRKSTMSGLPHKFANRGGAGKGRRYPTKEYSDRSRSGSETRLYHNHQSKRHHASSDKMGNMAGETYSRSQSRTPSSPRGPPDPESLKLGSIFKKQKTLEELAKHKQLQSQQLMMMDAAAKQSGDHQFANNPESESFLKSAMDTANTASVKRFQMLTNPSLAKESNYYGNDTAININKSMESNNKSGQSGASQSSQQSKININFKNFQSNYSAPDDINMNTMETQNFNNFNASSNIQLSAHDAEMLVASTTNYKNQSNINAPNALLDDFDGDDDWRTMAGKSSGNMNKSGGTTVSTADKLNQELEARLKEVTGNDKAVANQNKRKRVESAEFDSNDLMDNQNTNLSSKNISSGPGGAYKFKTQAVVDTFKHYLEQAYREDCNTLYGVSKVLICDDNLRASILKSADDNVKQLASKALNDLADIFKRVKTQTMET